MPNQILSGWMLSPNWQQVILAYREFWQNPLLLLWISLCLVCAALWIANRPISNIVQS
jgi:hypothetical protein